MRCANDLDGPFAASNYSDFALYLRTQEMFLLKTQLLDNALVDLDGNKRFCGQGFGCNAPGPYGDRVEEADFWRGGVAELTVTWVWDHFGSMVPQAGFVSKSNRVHANRALFQWLNLLDHRKDTTGAKHLTALRPLLSLRLGGEDDTVIWCLKNMGMFLGSTTGVRGRRICGGKSGAPLALSIAAQPLKCCFRRVNRTVNRACRSG
jgi:hypothetical protein